MVHYYFCKVCKVYSDEILTKFQRRYTNLAPFCPNNCKTKFGKERMSVVSEENVILSGSVYLSLNHRTKRALVKSEEGETYNSILKKHLIDAKKHESD